VSADCKNYAVTVNAAELAAYTAYTSSYRVVLSCTGAPTSATVSNTLPITNNNDGTGNGSAIGSWRPPQLSGTCSVSATATITQNPGETPFTLTPQRNTSSFTCTPPPPPPSIKLVKKTEGVYTPGRTDGNAPTVPYPGTVHWTYEVTNNGGVPLSNISVTDSKGVLVGCMKTSLAVNESTTCSASGPSVNVALDPTSVAGSCPAGGGKLYENGASVVGKAPDGTIVNDNSVSHYCNPAAPSMTLKKLTNGVDTPLRTDGLAPQVAAGQPVTWAYIVTNTGNLVLNNVNVSDDKVGFICTIPSLAVGANQSCTKGGTAQDVSLSAITGKCGSTAPAPLYENTGTATATASNGAPLSATYPSHYCNPPAPNYTLKKLTNGVDTPLASDGKAPQLAVGATATWTYIVTNTGNVPLVNIFITDDKAGFVCTVATLGLGASAQCTLTGFAYAPSGTVTGVCSSVPNTPLYENKATSVVTVNGTSIQRTYLSHYCVPQGKAFTIPTDPNKLSSMEGAISIMPGDWVSGGVSFTFKNGGHAATNYTVQAWVDVPVTCKQGGGAGGTISIPLGAPGTGANGPVWTYSIAVGDTNWLPTGDANSVNSWQGSVQAPALCGAQPMDASKGARLRSTVLQSPSTGSLVNWRFKYRDPNAKGKGNVNCLDTTDSRRAKADVCGASWSGTVTDP
jgi:hypothetical protein